MKEAKKLHKKRPNLSKIRRKARQRALQILYQLDTTYGQEEPSFEHFWATFPSKPEVREYAERLVRGVLQYKDVIDDRIKWTAENWNLNRMALVDRNILRIATFELLFLQEVPPKVAINEAIEIAKVYGTEKSGSFINGILDQIKNSACLYKDILARAQERSNGGEGDGEGQ